MRRMKGIARLMAGANYLDSAAILADSDHRLTANAMITQDWSCRAVW